MSLASEALSFKRAFGVPLADGAPARGVANPLPEGPPDELLLGSRRQVSRFFGRCLPPVLLGFTDERLAMTATHRLACFLALACWSCEGSSSDADPGTSPTSSGGASAADSGSPGQAGSGGSNAVGTPGSAVADFCPRLGQAVCHHLQLCLRKLQHSGRSIEWYFSRSMRPPARSARGRRLCAGLRMRQRSVPPEPMLGKNLSAVLSPLPARPAFTARFCARSKRLRRPR
jgi:hypothetical protein